MKKMKVYMCIILYIYIYVYNNFFIKKQRSRQHNVLF